MLASQFFVATLKEAPSDAEIVSHKLMLRAGLIRRLAGGIYTWMPMGLRVLRKVEHIVREEMDRAGAIELLMPAVQPFELWEESGRGPKYGPELLRFKDRHQREFVIGPTHEEVITDVVRRDIRSYRQLPRHFYQIQTKFRDEIRPRFGVMRAREFLMKDAYSFHLSPECMANEYANMYATYTRIFTRLGLKFRAVNADTGAIGGSASHEFHVLADSGEDAIAFSTGSEYAANIEMAEAVAPATLRPAAGAAMHKVTTPWQRTCEEVAKVLDIALTRTVKSVALMTADGQFVLALVRGDHVVNEVKLAKLAGMSDYRLATEAEIVDHLGSEPGFIGPVAPRKSIRVIADRSVAAMADFVVGANEKGFHLADVNWGRDLPEPEIVADIRNVVEGDASPDGAGEIKIARGIEVGHVFQLGQKYAEAMGATVADVHQKSQVMYMGCYGIGVSRIVAAAVEQNFDDNGICWPEPVAPWRVAVCVINPKSDPKVSEAATALYAELTARGIDTVIDDRGLRAGSMFADIELIGIPHRVVVSERGLAAGTYEYRARRASEAESLDHAALMAKFG